MKGYGRYERVVIVVCLVVGFALIVVPLLAAVVGHLAK